MELSYKKGFLLLWHSFWYLNFLSTPFSVFISEQVMSFNIAANTFFPSPFSSIMFAQLFWTLVYSLAHFWCGLLNFTELPVSSQVRTHILVDVPGVIFVVVGMEFPKRQRWPIFRLCNIIFSVIWNMAAFHFKHSLRCICSALFAPSADHALTQQLC